MKALLLKDFYMTLKYCKAIFLIIIIFSAAAILGEDNMFFVTYPGILAGMIPVTLLGYDEQSKWGEYCGVLPFTKAQIVSAKYLIGIIAQIAVMLIISITQFVKMQMENAFDANSFFIVIITLFIMSCASVATTLPFIFKYGSEKGRIAYYTMIGAICAGSVILPMIFDDIVWISKTNFSGTLICAIGVLLYAISWYLSIKFYKKREVKH